MDMAGNKATFIKAITGYLLVLLVLFGTVLVPLRGMLLFGDDVHRQYYFYRQFFNQWIHQGIVPFWNPYYFSGSPFIANAIVNIFYPATWLYTFLPLSTAYSAHVALHLAIAMIGMYWLCRRWVPAVPAWGAGAVFGLSGFFTSRIWAGHMDVIAAASYMPWVFGTFWMAVKEGSGRRIIMAGFVFGLQLLSGYQTMAFFTIQAVGFALLALLIEKKSARAIVRMALAGTIGIGVAAVQILPVGEFFAHSIRTFPLPYSWTSYGSLTASSLKQFFSPFPFGDQITYTGPAPNYPEHAFFIGRITLAVILLCLGFLFRKRTMRILAFLFSGIALYSLWMSLAAQAPVDLQKILWNIIPMYRYLRFPSRHLVLFVFSASALVGLSLAMVRSRMLQTALVMGICVEMLWFGRHFIAVKEIPEARHDSQLVAMLQRDSEPYRLLQNFGVWVPPRDSLDFDAVMSYKIFSATGYDPSILRNYYEFSDAVNGSKQPSILNHDVQIPYLNVYSRYLDFLNIKYILVPPTYDPIGITGDRFVLVREDLARQYRLYENTTVQPRFFFVPELRILPSREDVAETIRQGREDPTQTVFTYTDALKSQSFVPDCTEGQKGSARIVSYTPNAISLRVSFPCNGILASSEVLYPGWDAYVDGKKTDIFEGNLAFRTIYVFKGEHTVDYRYQPKIFIIGGIVSGITVAMSLAWLLLEKRSNGILRRRA